MHAGAERPAAGERKNSMIHFECDYAEGCHPSILAALAATNDEQTPGYGLDPHCDRARALIRTACRAPEADVHFLVGGTQANAIVIAAALRPHQGALCACTGHINCHEAASIENTGHKILALPNTDGKITAQQVAACAAAYYDGGAPEYLTEPKLVYLSFPTEKGTLYSAQELRDIREVCQKYGMYLFVDGARMGYGLGAADNDLTLKDFAELTDVFYIGGTKCGALFGEALVITEPRLQYRFKAYMKQHGAVLAKGWLMGMQFVTMLESGEYFEKTKRADELAMQIREAFAAKSVPFWVESPTNQQFVILSQQQKEALAQGYYFEEEGTDEQGTVVRFCTSWATTQAEVDALVADIAKL